MLLEMFFVKNSRWVIKDSKIFQPYFDFSFFASKNSDYQIKFPKTPIALQQF